MPSGSKWTVRIIVILALAVGARLAWLGGEGLWFDETASRWLAGGADYWSEFLVRNARETTPPLFFLLLRGWWGLLQMLGWDHPSAAGLRGLNVILDLVVLAGLVLVVRRHAGQTPAAIAGLLYALNPLAIHHAQDLRMYTVGTLATLVAFGLLLELLRPRHAPASAVGGVSRVAGSLPTRYRLVALGYSCACAAMVLSHYVLALYCVALGLVGAMVFVARRNWSGLTGLVAYSGMAVALVIPWLLVPMALRGRLETAGASWMKQPLWWEGFRALWQEWWVGPSILLPPRLLGNALAVAVATGGVLMVATWGRLRPRSWRFVVWAMLVWSVATALAWLVGLIGPTVLNPERFPAFATPLFCGVFGVFLASVRTNGIRCGLLLLIIGFWCASIVIQQGRQTWSAHEVVTPELARLAPQALFVSDEFLSEGFAQHGPEVDPPLDPVVLRPIWGKIPGPLAQWRAFAALDPDQPVAIVLHHRPFSGEDPNRPLFNLLQLVSREPCFLPEHNTIRSHAAHRLGPIRSVVPEWWSEFPIPPRERVAWPDPPLHEAFPPDDVLGCVRGFSDRRFFHGLGKDGRRWSRPCGWLDFPGWQAGQRFDHPTTITLLVEYPPRLTPDYSPDLILRTYRLNRPNIYVDTPGVEWTSAPLTISCPVPSGTGGIRIAWNMNGVNPAKMSNSNDDRDLGLHFQAVGLNYSAPATEWWQGR